MDVKLGLGLSTGMFYTAAAGTSLPSTAATTPGSAWTKVGDVSDAGITLALNKTVTNLRNWANVVKRVIMTEHNETIQSPLMDTTAQVLKTVMGDSNVTVDGQNTTVNLSDGELPPEKAFLWIMKDGDDMIMIGCSHGQVSAVDNVSFAPGGAINWVPTITAMGDDGFKLLMNEAHGATGTT